MDIAIPKILPPGMGDGALRAADAARSALSSASARNAEASLQAQGLGLDTKLGPTQASGVSGVSGLAGSDATAGAGGVMQSFSTLLSQAVQDIDQTQRIADDGAARLAAGEPVDLHTVMIGMENANLSLGMALQVRNKLLEAYQEVMRMVI